jgi:alkaline phosphatase
MTRSLLVTLRKCETRLIRAMALLIAWTVVAGTAQLGHAQTMPDDWVRHLQKNAFQQEQADWGYWGIRPDKFSTWTNHSNRLVPVYSYGNELDGIAGKNSIYRDETKLATRYGYVPTATLNPNAEYFDQVQLFDLQQQAVRAGKRFIFLIIFDGMDWQTTQAAAVVRSRKVGYETGRGTGLRFQDYRSPIFDYGYMATSAHNQGTEIDVDAQRVLNPGGNRKGGYSAELGGDRPWSRQVVGEYLQGRYRLADHVVPASAASATAMTAGVKSYLGAVNVDFEGRPAEPIARTLQRERGFSVGVVTSVPISHATPAAAYANNVTRDDYQDLTRDLLGLPSIAHRSQPLSGVDVLIGSGWNETVLEPGGQGLNFVPGNLFLTDQDRNRIDVSQGGKYRTVERTPGVNGTEALLTAARTAAGNNERLFGLFGVGGGHLPYQTADGKYNPTRGVNKSESYDSSDLDENPTLAVMTQAALRVLETNERGFWMMVEPGDVDWANHDNNIDNAIGAVLSGDEAFAVITDWIDRNRAWDRSVVIVTADHGHLFNLIDPGMLIQAPRDPAGE